MSQVLDWILEELQCLMGKEQAILERFAGAGFWKNEGTLRLEGSVFAGLGNSWGQLLKSCILEQLPFGEADTVKGDSPEVHFC